MLKDHLGNVRMVLTEEQSIDDYPTATMEDVSAASETLYYTQINETRANRHPGMPADNSTTPNDKVAQLSNTGQRIGPGILLKVQAGDQLELWCRSWWTGTMGGQTNSNQTGIKDGVAALLGLLMPGASGGKIGAAQVGSNGSFFGSAILSFLQGNNPEQGDRPKAFVNWMFLNEQFEYTNGNGSGSEKVSTVNDYKLHERNFGNSNAITAKQSGYVYIYTSNESSLSVYFDNLKVKHHRGALLEETHYYPFGLTMAGISSKAAGKLENKFKYNGIEHNTDFDLNMYDAFYRNLDPQIGRFWQIDPETESLEEFSPYESMGNNPICNIDPLGDFKTKFGAILHSIFNGGDVHKNNRGEWYVQKGIQGDDGSAGISLSFGKGRNSNSSYREKLANEYNNLEQIDQLVEQGIWDRELSEEVANQNTVGLGLNMSLPTLKPISRLKSLRQTSEENSEVSEKAEKDIDQSANTNIASPKLSKVNKSKSVETIGGKYTKTTEVRPGKGPGQSRSEYIRYKNQDGKVIRTYKDSYDRSNRFQHRKSLRGGPEGRPQ